MEEHDKLSKLTMWSKIKEFISDGLNYSEISRRLEIDRHTVSLYASINLKSIRECRQFLLFIFYICGGRGRLFSSVV